MNIFYKIFNSPRLKQLLSWGGILLGLIGMGFVINRFIIYQISLPALSLQTIGILIGMVILYGGNNLLLVKAWQNILNYHGAYVNYNQAIHIYGRSQLAKYIPGNIFQYAGRQALGVSAGLANKPLALSAIWELGWIASIGGAFIFLSLSLIASEITPLTSCFLFILVIIILVWVAWRRFGSSISYAAILYIIFHFISGSIFSVILLILAAPLQNYLYSNIASVCGAYVVAWLIGLITPGAPGGMGIRETVLYLFLSSLIKPGDLIVAILLSRIVTIAGDGLFFLISYIV